MLQQPTSLSLALNYNLPDSYATSPDSSNYSYWSGPDISNVTGDVVAVLNSAGSFGIVYGSSSNGAVYVYKNDGDNGTLSSATNQTLVRSSVLRRLTLETGGNLRLYRWDNDLNGSSQWVPEWAAVSNPCDIAGICGDGICNLDISKTNASCSSLPGNSSVAGKCGPSQHENPPSPFNIAVVQQTNYYYSESSVIANYSDAATVSKCGDACLTDCECVASVYGLDEEKPYCWVLRRLDFGGFEDPGSTLFVKVVSNGSSSTTTTPESNGNGSVNSAKIVVLPIVLSMTVLVGLLCCLLYISVHKRRSLKKSLRNSLILSGAPVNFSFRDLQSKTNNFSHLLGIGGFGCVYKGRLEDGGLVAVKRLERVLPHGEKEFVTEVNTIGSMHHLNLVRLYGYCSQGSQHRYVCNIKDLFGISIL
ncbi:non-specific serine,threonine protein kinase [Sarracenia purpurea var. burkii]